MTLVVAIDGPGGSGKSSVSRGVAERIGWAHLDTGAFYRAATLLVLRSGVDPASAAHVTEVLRPHRIEYAAGCTAVDGDDVSKAIRADDVTAAVSAVSAHPQVRTWMVRLQRFWAAARTGSVVEGRDIGTVVFPRACLKIFLTADPAERARRRAGETGATVDAVEAALQRRDRLDSTRTSSPLTPADDAIVIDTTTLSLDQVIETVVAAVPASLSARGNTPQD